MIDRENAFSAANEPDPSVRWRARRMWLASGRPHGREQDYLRRARELQTLDDNPTTRPLPNMVYIVVQDGSLRDRLRAICESNGYRVHLWTSGADLIHALPEIEAGCVIAGSNGPAGTAPVLLEQLGRSGRKLPVIALADHGDVTGAIAAVRAGAADVLETPVTERSLVASIRTAAGQASRR